MSAFLSRWVAELWSILAESGPWLLFGFLVAGYLRTLIREELILRHLGRDDFRSVVIAALVGAPLPLCSCSVIPTAIALRRSGASKGATTAFMVSTPETGVDSIGLTWALLDPILTVVRPLAALVTALTSGTLVNALVRRGWDAAPIAGPPEPEGAGCCADEHEQHDAGTRLAQDAPRGFLAATRRAFEYAFGPLMADLTPAFLLGFALSALIAVLVPAEFFREVLPGGMVAMLAMLVVAMPLYVCAAATTPVAAALILKGLEPGAAVVLLLAGPAVNIATIVVMRPVLGGRVIAAYVASIALCSLGIGWLVNLLYASLGRGPEAIVRGLEEGPRSILSIVGGAVLALLLLRHALELDLSARWGRSLRALAAPLGFDPTTRGAKLLAALALLLALASTAIGVVRPGEVGFRMRLGRVVSVFEEAGPHLLLPWPLERLEILRTTEVRGLRSGSAREAESRGSYQVVTGDEKLLSIEHAVHYRVSDAYRYRFAVADPEQLLAALAESTLRRSAARRTTDELQIGDRPAFETELRASIQEELAALGAGLEVVSVEVLYVHAPEEVHDAYRDVASAYEDRERQVRRAERYAKELGAQARASAFRREEAAAAGADAVLQKARGEARAFLSLFEAQAGEPGLFHARARLEAAETALRDARLVLVLDDRIEVVPIERGAAPPAAESGPRSAPERPLLPRIDD